MSSTTSSSSTEIIVLHHNQDDPVAIPSQFICPISLTLMADPVTLPSGHTFDRRSIEKWMHDGHTTCPFTRQTIVAYDDLVPNHVLRRIIHSWCQRNLSNYGLDVAGAITPPVDPSEIPFLLDSIDGHGAVNPAHALAKLCHLCSSRPRYRKQLIDAGALAKLGRLLSESNLSTGTESQQEISKLAMKGLKLAEVVTEGVEDVQGTEEFVSSVAAMATRGREWEELGKVTGVCVGVLSRVKMTERMRRVVGAEKGFMESVVGVIGRGGGGSGGWWWTKAGMLLLLELCKSPTYNNNNVVLAVEAGVVPCLVQHLQRRRRRSATHVAVAVAVAAAATNVDVLIPPPPALSDRLLRGTRRLASHIARSSFWPAKLLLLRKSLSHAHVHQHHAPPWPLATMATTSPPHGFPPPSIPPPPHHCKLLARSTTNHLSFHHRKSALRVLQVLSHCAEGRAAIAPHIGLIVDHMVGCSQSSTLLATNILWLLLQAYPTSSALKQQALKHGALIKAIAIMQCTSAPTIRCVAMRVATSLLELTPCVSQTVILSSNQFILK